MSDERLKALYRRQSARRDAALTSDDLSDALARSGYPDEEGTPLDRIAASTAHADVLRTALALGGDAAQLSRELAALRAPVSRAPARGWLALAAGMGAAAILLVTLRPGSTPAPLAVDASATDEAIFAVSFETASQETILGASFEADSAADAAPAEAQAIFGGDFDS